MDPRSEIEMSGRSGRAKRFVWAAFLTGVVVPLGGCGSILGMLGTDEPRVVLKGQDSAGAAIELEKRGDDLTAARVIDVVLGTGEGEIISEEEGQIEFTIVFPGGAAITYRGQRTDAARRDELMLSGTWRQHSGGVFGEDFGTWEVLQPVSGTQ